MLLDYQYQRLIHSAQRKVGGSRERMGRLAGSLDALSPFKVLSRGYSITQKDDGTVVSTIGQVEAGEKLRLRVSDGIITCAASGKEKDNGGKKADL